MQLTTDQLIMLKNPYYSYKGKNYKVIKLVKIKSVVTNVWFDGVEYEPLYKMPPGEWEGSFVRPLEDFLNKFSPNNIDLPNNHLWP